MRVAIIDCGTNTFNLLITDVSNGNITVVHKNQIPVTIAKGGIEKNIIAPDAYQRALGAMHTYSLQIKKWQVDKIIATSTSAFRSAENGPQLRNEIEQTTGISIEIISGEQEAEYIYRGVIWALPPQPNTTYLIMDIGGGSTEFILYNDHEVLFKESYPLGASRLIEKFKPADPIANGNIETYYAYFKEILENSLIKQCAIHSPDILVGSSGFFDTLRAITHYQFHSDQSFPEKEINYPIRLEEFTYSYTLLLHSNYKERLEIKGMTPFRAEMMGMSILLTDYVIKTTQVKTIINTTYALKEGVLKTFLENLP